MPTKKKEKGQIDVPEVLKKIERELHKANTTEGVKRLEISLDLEAIRAGKVSGKKVTICSENVTDD